MTGPDEEGWQRLHPLSPVLRGGFVLLAVAGYAISQLFDRVLSAVDPSGGLPGDYTGGGQDEGTEIALDYPLVAFGLLVLVVAAIAGVSWVSWRFTRFRISQAQVELRSGVLFRQHRQVPLERIQAVETARPLLARALGLAQVVVQSAGGSDSHLTLAFLGADRAEGVRAHLLDLAGRTDEERAHGAPHPGAEAPPGALPAPDGTPGLRARGDEDAEPVVSVPNGRLFVATILHGSTIVLGIIVVGVLVGGGVMRFGAGALAGLPALVPVVFGLGVSRVRELLVHGNFSLARTPTSLRVRHGLTDLRVASVPLHRVQAVEVLQPLWWRPWGWWRVRLNVAGVEGGQGDATTETVVLPVGSTEDALTVLETLGASRQDPLVLEALHGTASGGAWVGPPREARWLDPWAWQRIGYALAHHLVLIRSGRWSRRAVFVPNARVQSLTLEQGPLQSRLGLSSAKVVSTPGPVSARVPHLSTEDAERFLAVVGERAGRARRPALGASVSTVASAQPLAPGATPLVD